jgi:hypothetical protein
MSLALLAEATLDAGTIHWNNTQGKSLALVSKARVACDRVSNPI